MLQETEDWYIRALEAVFNMVGPIELRVVLRDREVALGNAHPLLRPQVKQALPYWHLTKNIATKCKLVLEKGEYDGFLAAWTSCIVQAAEEGLEEGKAALMEEIRSWRAIRHNRLIHLILT
jgi:hypothetical protein